MAAMTESAAEKVAGWARIFELSAGLSSIVGDEDGLSPRLSPRQDRTRPDPEPVKTCTIPFVWHTPIPCNCGAAGHPENRWRARQRRFLIFVVVIAEIVYPAST